MNELLPYPLLGIVGQHELKTALTLALVNPAVGGVLLSGPYGVGKTTAVRGLLDIMPLVKRSRCENNCPPDDQSDLCPTCLEYLERGESRLKDDLMRLIELPLNARLEDVVGGLNERVAIEQQRVVLEEGVLARANNNLLYVDEINLLDHAVIDAILDAAAQGQTFVRRGAMVKLYQSRLILVGSMNPEEGRLRPQILDRLGLRVWVGSQPNARERLEIYRRAIAFRHDRTAFRTAYAQATNQLRLDVLKARELLPKVQLTKTAERYAMQVITQMAIPSHRAEIVLLEAARARAAADDRVRATPNDIKAVAAMALRWRQSPHLNDFLQQHAIEERLIAQALQG